MPWPTLRRRGATAVLISGLVLAMNLIVRCAATRLKIMCRFGKCVSAGVSACLTNIVLWLKMLIARLIILLRIRSGTLTVRTCLSIWLSWWTLAMLVVEPAAVPVGQSPVVANMFLLNLCVTLLGLTLLARHVATSGAKLSVGLIVVRTCVWQVCVVVIAAIGGPRPGTMTVCVNRCVARLMIVCSTLLLCRRMR